MVRVQCGVPYVVGSSKAERQVVALKKRERYPSIHPLEFRETEIQVYVQNGRTVKNGFAMKPDIASPDHGAIAQLGEHLPCTQGVEGSSPSGSTK